MSVQGKADRCEVTASNGNGTPGGEATLTMDILFKTLSK